MMNNSLYAARRLQHLALLFLIVLISACRRDPGGDRLKDSTAVLHDTTAPATITSRDNIVDTLSSPADSTAPQDTVISTESENIRLTMPRPHQKITTGKIQIAGTARTFENALSYRLKGSDGTMLFEGHTTSQGEMGSFNPFTITARIPDGYNGELMVEVFQYSAKDGAPVDMVRLPVQVSGAGAKDITLQVFFTNSRMGSSVNCQKVFPVARRIPRTEGVAAAAIGQLLLGPDVTDGAARYSTEIPPGTRLRGITIDNGTAKVDFSAELNHVAGSCRVAAIRAQIEKTLRQFPTIRSVVITVEGNGDGVLQP